MQTRVYKNTFSMANRSHAHGSLLHTNYSWPHYSNETHTAPVWSAVQELVNNSASGYTCTHTHNNECLQLHIYKLWRAPKWEWFTLWDILDYSFRHAERQPSAHNDWVYMFLWYAWCVFIYKSDRGGQVMSGKQWFANKRLNWSL